jgi:hypothetical protein
METQNIIEFLKQLTFDLFEGRKSKEQIVHELSHKISASEMADLPSFGKGNDLAQDVYWALLHLENENGFETTDDEIQFLVECLRGNRVNSQEDFNKFLKDKK